jgi:peroxiredoxin
MVLLESLNLEMGSEAIDFRLPATDEKFYELKAFADKKVLVIIFMCNHCPYVQAIWERLVKLKAKYMNDAVEFVGINPNLNPVNKESSSDSA